MDPWRHVDADDDDVADFLAGTVEAVVEQGAWVHPDARFVARDGQIGVVCDAADGAPLLRVPSQAFVRITRVSWTDDADALSFDGLRDELTDVETELLLLQTALHNVCGKVPWLRRSHPLLADDVTSDVVDAVRAFDASFRATPMTAAEVFWSNRVFRIAMEPGGVAEPVAIPLVDLIDHRSGAAVGLWTGDAFVVAASPDSRGACALDYGYDRDAITMAATYGFVDTSASIAHSAVSDAVYGRTPDIPRAVVEADLALIDTLLDVTTGDAPALTVLHKAATHHRAVIAAT